MAKKQAIRWSAEAGAAANARTHLPGLAKEYFRAGRKLVSSRHPAHVMHGFRLRTKHFRYTLELFREVYGADLEQRLKLLKPLQSALGDLNDCVAAREFLGSDEPHVRLHLKKRAKKKIAEFEEYWRGTFDAPGQRAEWLAWLSGGPAQ